MATTINLEDIKFAYADVVPYTRVYGDYQDFVSSVSFKLTATYQGTTLFNQFSYTYEEPVFDAANPYLGFEDWMKNKLVPLLDSLVLAYKWKTDLKNKLETVVNATTPRPVVIDPSSNEASLPEGAVVSPETGAVTTGTTSTES